MTSKSAATTRIQRIVEEIPRLMGITSVTPKFIRWERSARIALARIFGEDSLHVQEFNDIRFAPSRAGKDRSIRIAACDRGLRRARAILESMLEEIEGYWSDDEQSSVSGTISEPIVAPKILDPPTTNRVFVVHGREGGARDTVARFLDGLELEPVILQEQPSEGRTIIEKFEDYSDVGYAVVLCTPDDVGALSSERNKLRPRPRQNVVLELGFFLGSLGRNRVCALLDDEMEMPSDYGGVLFVPLDGGEGWKLTLARELRAAGMSIDMNRIA